MDRRGFLKYLVGGGVALGAAGLVKLEVPEDLPTEDVWVDHQLSDISAAYLQASEGFIADKIFSRKIKEHGPITTHKDEARYATWFTCENCKKSVCLTDRAIYEADNYLNKESLAAHRLGFPCTGSPIEDIKASIKKIKAYTGIEPNTLIVGTRQYEFIKAYAQKNL